jgi:hypothetical protein
MPEARPGYGVKKLLVWMGAILAASGTACQIAGITSLLLANAVLIFGIWILTVAEVWFSESVNRTGRYKPSIIAVACCFSGCAALAVSGAINNVRLNNLAQQIAKANTTTINQDSPSQPRVSEPPKRIPDHTFKHRSTALPGKEQPTADPITNADPDVKLLSDAERLCIALQGWHKTKINQRVERENRMKKEIGERGLDQQGANVQMWWVEQAWWDETLPDYQQTFVPELMRTRRLMLALAPEAAGSTSHWENPGTSGGITGIEFDFASLIMVYRIHLHKMGKITVALTPDEQSMDRNGLKFIFSNLVESEYQ